MFLELEGRDSLDKKFSVLELVFEVDYFLWPTTCPGGFSKPAVLLLRAPVAVPPGSPSVLALPL